MQTSVAASGERAPAGLNPTSTPGAQVIRLSAGHWRLQVPAGPAGRYRLAQLDNYAGLPRRNFPIQPGFRLALQARASAPLLPGTWGFGLWNNPFGMSILSGAELLRLPALPNAAWWFFASPPNHLALRDDLPAQGWLAGTFRSPRWPAALLALAAPGVPLLALPPAGRLLRRLASRIARQETALAVVDPTAWHTYTLEWQAGRVICTLDQARLLETPLSPAGPLGLVIWIDNQWAAWEPTGRIGFGALENPQPAWIEIRALAVGRA